MELNNHAPNSSSFYFFLWLPFKSSSPKPWEQLKGASLEGTNLPLSITWMQRKHPIKCMQGIKYEWNEELGD